MQLDIGTRIDEKYDLTEHIGVGSSGEIWKAISKSKQIVAIKFMRENLITSRSVSKHLERLEREINALKLLQHPNIPTIYEWNLEYERPYFVMQFVDSPSLDKLIERGELAKQNIRKRHNIIVKIASALDEAHDKDIIHRDIKPGNINGVDEPYLMDFSIALAIDKSDATNMNIGTAIYMPPDFAAPDALGDSWSFAVVAFEILFGRHPIFDYKADASLIKKGMYARFEAKKRLDDKKWVKPSQMERSELPKDLQRADLDRLDEIFIKALGPREERYVSMIEFAEDLEKAIWVPGNTEAMVADEELNAAAVQAAQAEAPADGRRSTQTIRTATQAMPAVGAGTPANVIATTRMGIIVQTLSWLMAALVVVSIMLLAYAEFSSLT